MKRICFDLIGVTILCGALWYTYRQHPLKQFDAAVEAIAKHPDAWIGRQVGISTNVIEQPILGPSIRSSHVNDRCVAAFDLLRSHPTPIPTTYYAEPGSMPTQETIWQYPTFFVRLYVSSGSDSDGTAVGVFSGSYKEFRKPDADSHFAPIEFSAPGRFLQAR